MSQVAVLDEGQEGRSSGFTRTMSCNSPRLEGASKAIEAIGVLPAQISFSRSVIREIVVIVRMAAVILFPVVLTGEELPLTATPRCLSAWHSFGTLGCFTLKVWLVQFGDCPYFPCPQGCVVVWGG